MTVQQLIAIDADALKEIATGLRLINERLDAVEMQRKPEWLTIKDYAKHVGRTKRTIRNWIDSGKVETKMDGEITFVRVSRAA